MNQKEKGYPSVIYNVPTKRYYQTLDLKNDPDLIAEYKKRHSKEHFWPEVGEGIRSIGILNMEIFLIGTRLFMVVETPLDFEWDSAFAKLAKMPIQEKWEEYMSIFQEADPSASSAEKWQMMEQIFSLPESCLLRNRF
ncbi:L-rhamnose mutarotase [Bacteroides sp. 224]|uniref:L-rhamnose mutarotase n=1 Tax=Bacteroides sp. 224 TaxID=2302936 RepID=UPI0013CFC623|nr:L-rhamnose mutarotase [Bacteroides sp. 224]NDV65239.1 L-rhamnose mutarotase [Bacteroides sp. 224]